jgi:hypothetical protein
LNAAPPRASGRVQVLERRSPSADAGALPRVAPDRVVHGDGIALVESSEGSTVTTDHIIRLRPETCPAWCVVRHGAGGTADEEDVVHIGGALLVRRTVLRLCTTIDPEEGTEDGPYVLVGSAEFTLHEAETLLASLTQLVDEGRGSLVPQQPEGALPVLDA